MREGGAKAMPRSSIGGRRGGNGAIILAVGVLFLAFFVIVFITQITTNEAWISGRASVNLFQPDIGVFLQPFLLFHQPIWGVSLDVAPGAVIFGWGIEVVFLAFSFVGIELLHNSAYVAGLIMGVAFEIGALVCVGVNWWTDYTYGTLGAGDWGHACFATMTAFVVAYFGNIGWMLIRYGLARL